MISAAFPYKKQRRKALGREMAYVEVGKGDPIVLLHGNPTRHTCGATYCLVHGAWADGKIARAICDFLGERAGQ